jgi:hypothetical protein
MWSGMPRPVVLMTFALALARASSRRARQRQRTAGPAVVAASPVQHELDESPRMPEQASMILAGSVLIGVAAAVRRAA